MRRGDEARGEVEATAHASGERLHELARLVGETEQLEQVVGPAAGLPLRQVVQATDDLEVEPGTHQAVDRGLLRGDADSPAHGRGSETTSKPATVALPSVGVETVVRMRSAVVLPAPLWPSRPSTVPGSHVEVEITQRPEVAEALAEALGVHPGVDRSGVGGGIRRVYCLFVHSTTDVSSTLYAWQPIFRTGGEEQPASPRKTGRASSARSTRN